ncbi:hypothetical protein ABEF95_001675 [Exophiala dermatitidis]
MLGLFGFGPLIYATCLLLNAVAILSEDRFLARIGWGKSQLHDPSTGVAFGAPVQDPESFRSKAINLISSIRTICRVPLILVNSMIIVYELMLG